MLETRVQGDITRHPLPIGLDPADKARDAVLGFSYGTAASAQNQVVLGDPIGQPALASDSQDLDVPKIIKGKRLDSLEFMQWFKGYFDKVTHGNPVVDYDPVARRMECKTGDWRPRVSSRKTANGSFSASGRRSPAREEVTAGACLGLFAPLSAPADASNVRKLNVVGGRLIVAS